MRMATATILSATLKNTFAMPEIVVSSLSIGTDIVVRIHAYCFGSVTNVLILFRYLFHRHLALVDLYLVYSTEKTIS